MRNIFHIISVLKARISQELGSKDELAVNRINITISNYTSGIACNLIGGNFFTGFLLLLNADDGFMGLITMVGLIGNLLQVLSPLLLERFQKRKLLLISSRGFFYLFNIVIIGIIPLIPSANKVKLMLILSAILFMNFISAIFSPGFSIWHIKSIPENIRVRYYTFYNITSSIIVYTTILASSKIIDGFKASGREMEGLMMFRAVALLLCFVDFYFLFKIKEYPNPRSGTRMSLISIFRNPLREKKYMISVLAACLWNYSASIPGPYFSVYMLKDLGVSYSFLNIINMFTIPALVIMTPLWLKRINSTSWLKTLYFSMGLIFLHYIGLSFVTGRTLILYPLCVIFYFLISPGINLVFSNMPFLNIPEEDQTNYIGFYSTMNNFAALLGIFTGKEFIKHTEEYTISLFGISMQNKQYILLLTAAVMLSAVVLTGMLQKKLEKLSLCSSYEKQDAEAQ